MKSVSILSAGTAAVIIALGSGCTHVASSRHRVTNQLTEHSRAFTTAVVDALQLQPTDQRDQFTSTALQLAQLDQRVEGFPLKPIPVEELIDPTGSQPQAQATARADLASRELTVQKLLSKQHQNEERLLAFGERFEVERNQQRLAWFKRGSAALVIIGAFIALFVLCPALIPVIIPIAGRLLAFCVGRFPALAGSAGVVSVKAFDALVEAIEHLVLNDLKVPKEQLRLEKWG